MNINMKEKELLKKFKNYKENSTSKEEDFKFKMKKSKNNDYYNKSLNKIIIYQLYQNI